MTQIQKIQIQKNLFPYCTICSNNVGGDPQKGQKAANWGPPSVVILAIIYMRGKVGGSKGTYMISIHSSYINTCNHL